MNRIISAIVLAAATTATTWAVQRWLNRDGGSRRGPRPQLDDWENEGGALAPHHAALETSQVARRA